MADFNKQQYFEDTDAALRNDDPSLSDNDNADLMKDLSEEEQMEVAEGLTAFLEDSNEKEENQNVKDMIKYLQSLTAGVKLSKLLDEMEDSSGVEEGSKETEKDDSDTVADEATADSEGTDPAQEAKEGKSEA